MVKVRNVAGVRTSNKAPRKSSPVRSRREMQQSNEISGHSSGGNPYFPRATPDWQRPITYFFKTSKSSSNQQTQNNDNAGSSNNESENKIEPVESENKIEPVNEPLAKKFKLAEDPAPEQPSCSNKMQSLLSGNYRVEPFNKIRKHISDKKKPKEIIFIDLTDSGSSNGFDDQKNYESDSVFKVEDSPDKEDSNTSSERRVVYYDEDSNFAADAVKVNDQNAEDSAKIIEENEENAAVETDDEEENAAEEMEENEENDDINQDTSGVNNANAEGEIDTSSDD